MSFLRHKMLRVGASGDPPTSGSFDLSTASYDKSLSVSGESSQPLDFCFNTSGTRLLIIDKSLATVFQYTLGAAFDIGTATYDNVSFSVYDQDTSPAGITFNDNGSKMFIVGFSSDAVHQYSTSSFSVASASYDNVSFSVADQCFGPRSINFSADGFLMYIVEPFYETVYQYDLSASFDITTASYTTSSYKNVGAQEGDPTGVVVSSDGSKMYITGFTDSVYEYDLSTPFNIKTAVYNGVSLNVSSVDSIPYGITLSSDDSRMFISGLENDSIYQFSASA